jgi:glycosyltransferase involved in cell wall biosynthesis
MNSTWGARLSGEKAIFVLEGLELGGAERQALLLSKLLRAEGADVEIWGFRDVGRLARLAEEIGVPWRLVQFSHRGSRRQRVRDLARLAFHLHRARPTILLPYLSGPNVACGVVWRFTGAHLCVWNQRDEGLWRFPRRLERLAVANVPLFVCNGPHLASFLIDSYGVAPHRVKIVPNAVDLAEPMNDPNEWRKRLHISNSTPAACMLASLRAPPKDHATLMNAWRYVVEDRRFVGSRPVLLLAGEGGNQQNELKSLSGELGLGDTVQFLGAIDDVAGLLSAVDLGILATTRAEGCPNALLEYMAAGLAVVATDVPAVRAVVPPEEFPYLVPSADARILAECIARLMLDRKLRLSLGELNQRHVDKHYRANHLAARMVHLLERASV